EASAIQNEIERAGHRDSFEFVMKWAAEPLDLLRELRRVKPTVVHFSGHGVQLRGCVRDVASSQQSVAAAIDDAVQEGALHFQDFDGRPRPVSTEAVAETLAAAGASVRLVVLSARSSEAHAKALCMHVDCVVNVVGSVQEDVSRSFAQGFYGGLADRASIAAAFLQGRAAIRLAGLSDSGHMQLQAREGVDAGHGGVAFPA